jgi:pyruvate ferredoxin oxidoreductase gamma subunit/2-oxoisovalerate ferredoxin oxidoreductase gamma subunit
MIEIRIHGRGGQGAVIASKILASAVFKEGNYAQAFPAFGVERRGAPVAAFARIDSEPIRLRCEIYEPDHLIVLDPTLIGFIDVSTGLKPEGIILVNSGEKPEYFGFPEKYRVVTVDANHIALKYGLGTKTQPIVNTAILGSFSKITGLVGLESLEKTIPDYVPIKIDENVAATREAYDAVSSLVIGDR